MSKEKFISLKEAAELSGYSPDYVGQLIRRGKLPGKQVFSNVSWMTTEEAILEYIDGSKKNSEAFSFLHWREFFASLIDFEMLYKILLGGAIALLGVFILLLIYILSVSIDHHIEKRYQQQLEQKI